MEPNIIEEVIKSNIGNDKNLTISHIINPKFSSLLPQRIKIESFDNIENSGKEILDAIYKELAELYGWQKRITKSAVEPREQSAAMRNSIMLLKESRETTKEVLRFNELTKIIVALSIANEVQMETIMKNCSQEVIAEMSEEVVRRLKEREMKK